MPPQIAKADRLHAVHEMRRRVDRTRFVNERAAGIEIADRQRVIVHTRRERCKQRLPVWHLLQQIRHVDADQPYRAEIDLDQTMRLRDIHAKHTMRGEAAASGDQHAGALWRRQQFAAMAIPGQCQRRAQPIR